MGVRTSVIGRSVAVLALVSSLTLSTGYLSRAHADSTTPIYLVTGSDVNVETLWRDTLIPDFTKAFPQYSVTYTNILHGTNMQGLVVNNLVAAKQAGQKTVDYDIFEDAPNNYQFPTGSTFKDYFLPLNAGNVPNVAKIDPSVELSAQGYGVAYRASAVVLAYNSQKVTNPPKSFADLIAWIKANPGKFTYCNPNDGGSGGNFVIAAIRSQMDPAQYVQMAKVPYNASFEKDWPKAWALLKSIQPDLFEHGFYPNGNLPILNLLAKGSLTVATAWSDQSLSALGTGLLPKYIKLTQINPPFPGGPTFLSVPKMAQNPAGARAFINFVLQPAEQAKIALAIDGFPSIEFKYIPSSVVKALGPIATGWDSFWPGGQYARDVNALWLKNVPSS